jgi:uncharacterized protein (TIRG00374 family)
LISAVCLAVVFYFADPRRLVEALRLADYRFVVLAIGLMLVWLLVRAIVWRTLLQDQASFKQVFFTINEGYLLNNILPFRLGEVGRAYLLSRKADLGFWQVFSSILIERSLDLALAAGLLLCTLPFVVGATWAREAALAAGVLVLLGLAVLYLMARNRAWSMAKFSLISTRWPRLGELTGERLEAFFNGLAVLTDGRRFVKAVGWILVDWFLAILEYYALLLAFFPQTQFLWAAFTLGVAALGIAAPSSPGAVGVYELSVVGALSLFGLDPSVALAFALTAHLINYLVTGLLGAYALSQEGETLIHLYHSVRRIPARE